MPLNNCYETRRQLLTGKTDRTTDLARIGSKRSGKPYGETAIGVDD
jgi:hypothetical protein